jgi:hypothetical protein
MGAFAQISRALATGLLLLGMLTILVPLLCAVVGALVYALATNGKVVELARLLYAAGILVTLYVVAGQVFRV